LDLASLSDLRIVSTVGAGDVFLGTFGAFKLKGFEDAQALYLANVAAALKASREDTRASPTFEEINRYAYDKKSRGSL
jgi:sugar/nucleoside kinase (ribokinase family)